MCVRCARVCVCVVVFISINIHKTSGGFVTIHGVLCIIFFGLVSFLSSFIRSFLFFIFILDHLLTAGQSKWGSVCGAQCLLLFWMILIYTIQHNRYTFISSDGIDHLTKTNNTNRKWNNVQWSTIFRTKLYVALHFRIENKRKRKKFCVN